MQATPATPPSEHRLSRIIAGCGYLGLRVGQSWNAQHRPTFGITRSELRADDLRRAGLDPLIADLSSETALKLPEVDVALWAVGFDRSSGVTREAIWLDGLRRFLNGFPAGPRRLIYVSSTSVYGQHTGEAVDECCPTCPNTEGGQYCLMAENLLQNVCTELFPRTDVIVLRMAGIYGPDRLLRRISDLTNQTPLPGEPDHCLNLIHVDDAVRMINYVADAAVVPSIINVVNCGSVTRRTYYTQLAKLAGVNAPVFASHENATDATGVTNPRVRGGNKRVMSRYRLNEAAGFEFDNVLMGLQQAYKATLP